MGRNVEYDREAECDGCGEIGAYDFYGDYYCINCIENDLENEDKDE